MHWFGWMTGLCWIMEMWYTVMSLSLGWKFLFFRGTTCFSQQTFFLFLHFLFFTLTWPYVGVGLVPNPVVNNRFVSLSAPWNPQLAGALLAPCIGQHTWIGSFRWNPWWVPWIRKHEQELMSVWLFTLHGLCAHDCLVIALCELFAHVWHSSVRIAPVYGC